MPGRTPTPRPPGLSQFFQNYDSFFASQTVPLVCGLVGDSQIDFYRPDTVVTVELKPYTDNSYNFTLLLRSQPVGRFIIAPYLDEAKKGSLYIEKGVLARALGGIEGWQELEALTDTAGFVLPSAGRAPARVAHPSKPVAVR